MQTPIPITSLEADINSPTEAAVPSTLRQIISDWLGIVASIACAIHCAAMPFVVAFLPMLGLSFLADESFHQVMVAVCTLLALAAFIPGWRRHRKWLPAGVALLGLSFISVAAFAFEDTCACCSSDPSGSQAESSNAETPAAACTDEGCEHCLAAKAANQAKEQAEQVEAPPAKMAGFVPWITPLGGILLVFAHIMNRRFSCLCGCCPKAE